MQGSESSGEQSETDGSIKERRGGKGRFRSGSAGESGGTQENTEKKGSDKAKTEGSNNTGSTSASANSTSTAV